MTRFDPNSLDQLPRTSRLGRWRLPIIALLALVAVEGASHLLIVLSRPLLVDPISAPRQLYASQSEAIRRYLDGDRRFWEFDPLIGWRWPANYEDSLYITNSAGLLGRQEYSAAPPKDRVRVSAFGNSFVVGADVHTDSSWLAQLGRQNPQLEVVNYGVAAFGNDQSFLQYLRDGRRMYPHVVLIGLAADNLVRNENIYRRFLTPNGPPLTKPRFVLRSDRSLVLLPNPLERPEDLRRYLHNPELVAELGDHDRFYAPELYANAPADWSATARLISGAWTRIRRRYLESEPLYLGSTLNPRSSGFTLATAIVEAFADSVRNDGAIPIVVALPSRASFDESVARRLSELEPLLDTLEARGLDVIDATDALIADPAAGEPDRLFTSGLHYTPYGSAAIAGWIGPEILRRARVGE